ncbi:MAG: RNA polymerase sigma factor [Bacteroidales bacterium]|nr:RNA polymerase sigma factor [Bacteroidales bacterium]
MKLSKETELNKLIKGLKQSNRDSQRLVYERYFGLMMSIGMRYCKDWDDAKEVVNTSFLKIFTKIDHYSGKGSFEGWMKRTVVNTALDFLKLRPTNNVSIEHLDAYHEDIFYTNDADVSITAEDILLLVQKLPDATRTVFNLYVIEGYKHKEIAEMLGISEGTSHWHVLNARRLLKEMLDKLN